jgi:hypothetical protein
MNPVRKALDRWKKSNPKGTVQQFAKELGYASADTVYRLLRDEFIPPVERLKKISEMSGEPLGRVTTYFADNVRRSA